MTKPITYRTVGYQKPSPALPATIRSAMNGFATICKTNFPNEDRSKLSLIPGAIVSSHLPTGWKHLDIYLPRHQNISHNRAQMSNSSCQSNEIDEQISCIINHICTKHGRGVKSLTITIPLNVGICGITNQRHVLKQSTISTLDALYMTESDDRSYISSFCERGHFPYLKKVEIHLQLYVSSSKLLCEGDRVSACCEVLNAFFDDFFKCGKPKRKLPCTINDLTITTLMKYDHNHAIIDKSACFDRNKISDTPIAKQGWDHAASSAFKQRLTYKEDNHALTAVAYNAVLPKLCQRLSISFPGLKQLSLEGPYIGSDFDPLENLNKAFANDNVQENQKDNACTNKLQPAVLGKLNKHPCEQYQKDSSIPPKKMDAIKLLSIKAQIERREDAVNAANIERQRHRRMYILNKLPDLLVLKVQDRRSHAEEITLRDQTRSSSKKKTPNKNLRAGVEYKITTEERNLANGIGTDQTERNGIVVSKSYWTRRLFYHEEKATQDLNILLPSKLSIFENEDKNSILTPQLQFENQTSSTKSEITIESKFLSSDDLNEKRESDSRTEISDSTKVMPYSFPTRNQSSSIIRKVNALSNTPNSDAINPLRLTLSSPTSIIIKSVSNFLSFSSSATEKATNNSNDENDGHSFSSKKLSFTSIQFKPGSTGFL